MAKIGCPACKKVYNVPEQTLGRVATCKCGNKFRLGKKPAVVASAATSARATSNSQPSPKQSSRPHVEEPPKTRDSFWDEALSEPSASSGLDEVASEFGAEVARPLHVPKQSRRSVGSSANWKVAADIAFRVAAIAMPFVVWFMAYSSLSKSMDEDSVGGPMLFSTVAFLVALVFGVTLAKYGIGFDSGSMRQRLTGLGLMLGGTVSAVVGVAVSAGLSYATSAAGFVVLGGFGFGLVIFFIGMLQFVTGRDLKSEFTHTRDM